MCLTGYVGRLDGVCIYESAQVGEMGLCVGGTYRGVLKSLLFSPVNSI